MSLETVNMDLAHKPLVKRLCGLWRHNRLPQALLVTGPCGEVSRASVLQLIKTMVCVTAQNSDAPCGHCGPCRRLVKGQCLDVIWERPPDEASVWGIEAVRSWSERLSLTPYETERVVLVVEEAHRMSLQAANALLKTLEEPPRHAILFLITDSSEKLLPTIRSRCSPVRVPVLTRSRAARLMRDVGMPPLESVVAAGLWEGSLDRRTLEEGSASWVALRDQIIDNRRTGGNNEDIIKQATSDVETTRRLLWLILTLVRDVWLARAGAGGCHWIHVDRADIIGQKARVETQTLEALTGDVMDAFRQWQQQLNVKIPVRLILDRLWTI